MSFLNNPLTLVAVALLGGLGFVLSVHQFSKEQTAAHLRRVEQIRAEEKVAQDRDVLQQWNPGIAVFLRLFDETTQHDGIAVPYGQSGGGRALVDPWCGLTIVSGADFDQTLVDINVLHDFH